MVSIIKSSPRLANRTPWIKIVISSKYNKIFRTRSQSYQTFFFIKWRFFPFFLLLSLIVCSMSKYCQCFEMAKLKSKKRKNDEIKVWLPVFFVVCVWRKPWVALFPNLPFYLESWQKNLKYFPCKYRQFAVLVNNLINLCEACWKRERERKKSNNWDVKTN